MVNISKANGAYKFIVKDKTIELFISRNGSIEMCEEDNPGETGFIFNSMKELTLFCNSLCDIIEAEDKKNEAK